GSLIVDRSRAADEARIDQPLVAGDREARAASDNVDSPVDRSFRGRELLGAEHDSVVAVELDFLNGADLRVGMHELEVSLVEPVLADLLHASPDRVVEDLILPV